MADDHIVLKHDELFVVCDTNGNIHPNGPHGAGLYFRDMRHLSTLDLCMDGCQLELLDTGTDAIDHMIVYLTNASVLSTELPGEEPALPQTVALTRRRELDTELREHVTITNYNRARVALRLTLRAAADFRDLFDIRGIAFDRQARPSLPVRDGGGDGYELAYASTDGTRYVTTVRAKPAPTEYAIEVDKGYTAELNRLVTVMPGHDRIVAAPAALPAPVVILTHDLTLEPGAATTVTYAVEPRVVPPSDTVETPRTLAQVAGGRLAENWRAGQAQITTSNAAFNSVLARSSSDLQTLVTPLPDGGSIIAAGIPWYVAPFGRDSCIAARQLLPWYPAVAAATLSYLASVQGDVDDPWRDEQPGKIVHEIRYGEMARRGLVPHSRYYGTVDATPLFLWLAAEYVDATGDVGLLAELDPHLDRALEWIDRYGDSNGDGFIDYVNRSSHGIQNQNWKDSDNSLQRPDGAPVPSPIASIEAQGYVYAAKERLAGVYARRGDADRAARLTAEAGRLRAAIEARYWQPDLRYYAEALDGDGRPATAISSNATHLLACGVPSDERAAAVVECFNQPELFSGWGVRTLSTAMPHYNPISYHNGSVWPHDNGFILWGLRRYREFGALDRLATALFDAAVRFPLGRLPELLCGFPRGNGPHDVPISYPVSCSPQAWAAGVPYVIVETLLGLRVDAANGAVGLDPWLPEWLREIEIRGLSVGQRTLDLRVAGHHDRSDVQILNNPGKVAVVLGAG